MRPRRCRKSLPGRRLNVEFLLIGWILGGIEGVSSESVYIWVNFRADFRWECVLQVRGSMR